MVSRFIFSLIVTLIAFIIPVTGQVKLRDSLRKTLTTYLATTANAEPLGNLGQTSTRTVFENDSVLNGYLDTAFTANAHLSYLHFPAMCSRLSEIYQGKGAYLKGIQIAETGLLMMTGNSIKNAKTLADLYINIASGYYYLSNYEKAATYYYTAIKEIEGRGKDNLTLGRAYCNIALVLYKMGERQKAHYYLDKAKTVAYIENAPKLLTSMLITSGNISLDERDYSNAIHFYKQAIAITSDDTQHNRIIELTALRNIGLAYINDDKPTKAIPYLQKASNLPIDEINPYYSNIDQSLGLAYLQLKNYDKAQQYFLSSLSIAEKFNMLAEIAQLQNWLGELYEEKGDYKKALHFQKQYQEMHEQMYTSERTLIVNDLEVKYRTAQKDKEITSNKLLITQQKGRIWKKNLLIASISVAGIAIVILAILFYSYRHRLQKRKLQVLQQEQELKMMQSIMEGEERERTRMARELHDGIGGMLSTTRMYFDKLPDGHPTLSLADDYTEAIQLLDETLSEVRKSAHNLLPELVLRHGLPEAVRLYCSKVSKGKKTAVDFQYYGHLETDSNSFHLSVYRIIQELIQNIFKHAKATEAIVQLSADSDVLSVTVEDNGIGMAQGVIPNHGLGLLSIRNRIKSLGGRFNMNSVEGKGTYIYLEFDLQQHLRYNEHKSIHS